MCLQLPLWTERNYSFMIPCHSLFAFIEYGILNDRITFYDPVQFDAVSRVRDTGSQVIHSSMYPSTCVVTCSFTDRLLLSIIGIV
jgi:hypothetical protein